MIPVRPAPMPSRRRLVAAGAALCCASPAVADVDACDAELLAIGRELDIILPEFTRRVALRRNRMEAAQVAAEEDPRWPACGRDDQLVMLGMMEIQHQVDGSEVDLDGLGCQVEALRRRSERLRATTFAGLRTKARLLAHSHGRIGEDDMDLASLLRDLGVLDATTFSSLSRQAARSRGDRAEASR